MNEESTKQRDVLFDPFDKQREFLEAMFNPNVDFVLFGGAIRGGKSFAGIGGLILAAKVYPRSRWAIVRKDLPTLKRNTVPVFNKVAPVNFIKGYNQDTQTVTFKNGSQILFFAENYDTDKDLNRWKGLEVNGFLLEEMNEMQEKSFWKAVERAGSYIIPGIPTEKQPPGIIVGTCNPSQGWVKKLVYEPHKMGTLRPKWRYIQSKIFDNPYMPKAYVESLKQMPAYEYEVFVNGDWDVQLKTGGEFYKCFELDRNTAAIEYDEFLPLHFSFDENVNPYITCTVWQIDGKKAFQIDEFCLESPRNRIKDLCADILDKYNNHLTGVFIYGDATSRKEDVKLEKGQNLFTIIEKELQKFHPIMRVPNANPSVVMRGNFINHVFDMGYKGVELFINPNCKRSISDYMGTKEDSDGKKAKTKERNPETKVTFEKWGHCTDANDYFICQAFINEYEQYQSSNEDHEYYFGEETQIDNNSY